MNFRLLLALSCCCLTSAIAKEPATNKNLAYVTNGHARQKLDVFTPPNATAACPLLVWIHGGAWIEGSKENCPGLGMLDKGWVVASINYRFSNHAIFPAQIEDCKAAIRWLRANAETYHIDKNRVAVWGASAGGHLAALLGTTGDVKEFEVGENLEQSSAVNCVIDWFGPTDFLNWGEKSVIKADNPKDVVARLFGGPVPDRKELAIKGSPVHWVKKSSASLLMMHGDQDNIVPLQQSELLQTAYKSAGADCTMKVYPGMGHGGPRFTDAEAIKIMVEFLEAHAGAKP